MEMYRKDIQGLLSFLADSPTAFHTADNFARMLREHGFQLLSERERWNIQPGGAYYTVRNGSSIIAFRIGSSLEDYSFKIAVSHSDFPTFKLKEKAELSGKGSLCEAQHRGVWGYPVYHLDGQASFAGRARHLAG